MDDQTITFDILADALRTGAAAVRARTRLQPAGGPGEKVFPPTFGGVVPIRVGDQDHKTKYAVEERRVAGESRLCVLLDSVASQANRMEEALLRAWNGGRAGFPLVRVDFTGATHEDPVLDLSTLLGDGYLTALQAPHRLADALLRDSMLGDLRFRASTPGRAFTEASPHHATPVYCLCPTALVFGMWDSTGPKGGQGAKFQRVLVSEIVGVGVAFGRKTSSRIDPAGVELNAGTVYLAADSDEEWTLDMGAARTDEKGRPIPFKRKSGDADARPGRPSNINHGNVTPSIDSEAGGVTMDYAEQITVLSLAGLRRLSFPRNVLGQPVGADRRADVEGAARTALAALALAAVALQREDGFDLRSRCALVPEGPLRLHVVGRDGDESRPYGLSPDAAVTLLDAASTAADRVGMGWSSDPVNLVPAPKLVQLIRQSRKVSAAGEAEEE